MVSPISYESDDSITDPNVNDVEVRTSHLPLNPSSNGDSESTAEDHTATSVAQQATASIRTATRTTSTLPTSNTVSFAGPSSSISSPPVFGNYDFEKSSEGNA